MNEQIIMRANELASHPIKQRDPHGLTYSLLLNFIQQNLNDACIDLDWNDENAHLLILMIKQITDRLTVDNATPYDIWQKADTHWSNIELKHYLHYAESVALLDPDVFENEDWYNELKAEVIENSGDSVEWLEKDLINALEYADYEFAHGRIDRGLSPSGSLHVAYEQYWMEVLDLVIGGISNAYQYDIDSYDEQFDFSTWVDNNVRGI